MVKHCQDGREWWCLPGGAVESGETPEEGALRELREECGIDGVIARQTSHVWLLGADHDAYSFLIDIGNQNPRLGHDPEVLEGKQPLALVDVQWLRLSEISERDRAFLWAAGLVGVGGFDAEVKSWGDDISYPGLEHSNKPAGGDAE